MLQIYCDGLCEPSNPGGVATYGWVAFDDKKQVDYEGYFIREGEGATNNLAEYTAVIRAIAYLWKTEQTHTSVEILSDSQLVIKQLRGEWAVRSATIRPLYERALRGLDGLSEFRLVWVPREENIAADEISRLAYRKHVEQHGAACVGRGPRWPR